MLSELPSMPHTVEPAARRATEMVIRVLLLSPPCSQVFVMCEDEAVRNNRLALLRKVADVSRGIMDLSQLPGF